MPTTDVPKLSVPFTVTDGRIDVVEQDSDAEIAQCVFALLATEAGTRIELPDYGIEDPAFQEDGIDLAAMRRDVGEWEPRADVFTDDEMVDLAHQVQVGV